MSIVAQEDHAEPLTLELSPGDAVLILCTPTRCTPRPRPRCVRPAQDLMCFDATVLQCHPHVHACHQLVAAHELTLDGERGAHALHLMATAIRESWPLRITPKATTRPSLAATVRGSVSGIIDY